MTQIFHSWCEPLPPGVTSSRAKCSDFLKLHANAPPRTAADNFPTTRQLLFAAKLCAERGLGMPPEVLQDRRACSRFLDETLQSSGGAYRVNELGAGGPPWHDDTDDPQGHAFWDEKPGATPGA